jgi:hypothetical protein
MIRWMEASVHYVCAWDGVLKAYQSQMEKEAVDGRSRSQ